jgi:hypothetical protein
VDELTGGCFSSFVGVFSDTKYSRADTLCYRHGLCSKLLAVRVAIKCKLNCTSLQFLPLKLFVGRERRASMQGQSFLLSTFDLC